MNVDTYIMLKTSLKERIIREVKTASHQAEKIYSEDWQHRCYQCKEDAIRGCLLYIGEYVLAAANALIEAAAKNFLLESDKKFMFKIALNMVYRKYHIFGAMSYEDYINNPQACQMYL